MTKNSERVSVPRELLERATRDFTGRPSWDALEDIRLKATEELRALLLAAPAEDVRAVVDEPSDAQILEAMRKPIYEADGGYVWDTERERVLEAGRAVLALRNPQRPVVMPERMHVYSAIETGWNACLDALEELNK